MPANSYQNKVIVITGGSSGIGLALAKEFAKQNASIVLIARDRNKLAKAQQEIGAISREANVDTVAANVSDKIQITEAINSIADKKGRIDVLINCAGIVTCGRFKDQSIEELENCMQVNYIGAVYASKAAWEYLKASKGQLSFVSSVAGYIGVIGYSSYTPTKFALTGLAECLRFEANDDGIQVSIIYPPDTETPMLEFDRLNNIPECTALSKNIKIKTADEVARIYINGLQRNKFEIYCDTESKAVRWIKNNFPGIAYRVSRMIINKERRKKG